MTVACSTEAISGGTLTYSKTRFPGERRVAVSGEGCRIRCRDGKQYIDTVAGLGAVSLGYQDLDVDLAVWEQLQRGVTFSLPTELEERVGQELLAFLGWGERVRFSKNGADVTNLAVRLARAHTGRDLIYSVAGAYHGHDDWAQVHAASMTAGIPSRWVIEGRLFFLDHLPEYTSACAIIVEPYPVQPVASVLYDEALRRLRLWCDNAGALLIYDCMITGMRLNRRGWPDDAPEPDLACYGKAMGNGMPLSALVGPAYLMDRVTEDVFFSTTFGGECLSLVAASAVMRAYKERDVLRRLEETGNRLQGVLRGKAIVHGVTADLEIVSYAARPVHKWRTPEQARVFTEAMLDAGILYQGYHNLMLATCEPEPLGKIEQAYEVALAKVAAL